jgi:hypothetical protein
LINKAKAYNDKWTEDIIKEKIFCVMSMFNIDYIPSSVQIRQSQISGLDGAISRTGGFIKNGI